MTPASTTRGAYELAVQYLDDAIGDVLATVDLNDWFVLFVTDNGTPDDARPTAGVSGRWKGSMYQGGINVPCVIAGPGIGVGTSPHVASVVDLAATIADLLDVALPCGAFLDSRSFAPGSQERDFVFSERFEVLASASYPQPAGFDGLAIVERLTTVGSTQARLKLLRQDVDGNGPGSSVDVVFNLVTDPGEQNPVDIALLPSGIRTRLLTELASLPPRLP